MSGTTRARALGAGRTGSQEGHARSAARRRPISQSTRAQGKSSTPQENAGLVRGWGHNEARRLRDGGIGAGGTMPTPVRRASSGGGSVPPPEPPQGATATIAKTPFFFVATRLRGHFQREGCNSMRATLATLDGVGRVEGADMQRRPLDGASPSLLRSRRSSDRSCISAPSICSWR